MIKDGELIKELVIKIPKKNINKLQKKEKILKNKLEKLILYQENTLDLKKNYFYNTVKKNMILKYKKNIKKSQNNLKMKI